MKAVRAGQGGVALVTAMVLALAVLVIGLSAIGAALGDERSARVERDRQVALAAAQAALRDAEHELDATAPTSPRFAALAGAGFVDGCGKAGAANHGLCTRAAPPSWQAIDLAGGDAALVPYGAYTGRTLGGVAQAPRYLIELLPLDAAYGRFYRITALGFGRRASTRVVLQSLYRKAPAPGAGVPPASPGAPDAPDTPGTAADPAAPSGPAEPETPAAPGAPNTPDTPNMPNPPNTPNTPAEPATPTGPTAPAPPTGPPTGPAAPATPANPTPTAGPAPPAAPGPPAGPAPPASPAPPVVPAPPPSSPASPPSSPPTPAAPAAPAGPGARIGWREVANWPALHAAAIR